MPLRLFAASLIGVALHTTASAQEAELLQFDGAGSSDFVIRVGPSPAPVDRSGVDQVSDLAGVLAADFAGFGSRGPIDAFSSSPSIEVPRWMRSGVAASSIMLPAAIRSQSLVYGCGDTRYRPRSDLPAATELRRAQHFPLIAAMACEEHIPVGLFDALIWQESRYQALARSPKGAIGLAQLMPGTARDLGVSDPWDVKENLRGGARYLRMQIEEFGRYDLALAAYNAGPGRVRATRGIPRIRETLEYVRNITTAWASQQHVDAPVYAPNPASTSARFRRAAVVDYTSSNVATPR
jgi:hypothetical protein